MRRNLCLLLLFYFTTFAALAQNDSSISINLNDPAPPLRIREWIKGAPIKGFEKGHVYVLEFWATWCQPCIAAMPHLSDLARQYKGNVTFIGIDIYESKIKAVKSINQVKVFVDSMGKNMDYHVAIEDSNFTVTDWLVASEEDANGIPRTFVVNGEGKLAWIGHPTELDGVLLKIVNHTWDVNKALAERNEYRRLEKLEDSVDVQLQLYAADPSKQFDLGKPDSALLLIDKIVKKEPKLKFAPSISFYTFSSLLKTDLRKAYEYGKTMLVTPSYRGTDYDAITYSIDWALKTNLITIPEQVFELGAEACQAKIDHDSFSTASLLKAYMKMADWYWRAKNKAKAIEAAQKAVEVMKNENES